MSAAQPNAGSEQRERIAEILWSFTGYYAAWDDAKEDRKHSGEVADCYLRADAILAALAPAEQDAPKRCEVCGWTLAANREEGCVPGDCSYRPAEGTDEYARIKARRAEINRKASVLWRAERPEQDAPKGRRVAYKFDPERGTTKRIVQEGAERPEVEREREALRAIASGPGQMLEHLMEKLIDVPMPITPSAMADAIAVDALRALPREPEERKEVVLYALAEWFDNPNLSPALAIRLDDGRYTPGMLLRRIANALAAQPRDAQPEPRP